MEKAEILAEICNVCGRERGNHVSNILKQEQLGRQNDHPIDFCPDHKTTTREKITFECSGLYRTPFGDLSENWDKEWNGKSEGEQHD